MLALRVTFLGLPALLGPTRYVDVPLGGRFLGRESSAGPYDLSHMRPDITPRMAP
jgi:hypothetical protein